MRQTEAGENAVPPNFMKGRRKELLSRLKYLCTSSVEICTCPSQDVMFRSNHMNVQAAADCDVIVPALL